MLGLVNVPACGGTHSLHIFILKVPALNPTEESNKLVRRCRVQCRFSPNKRNDLSHLASSCRINFIGFTKTCLHSELKLNHQNHPDSKSGGFALYVKSSLRSRRLTPLLLLPILVFVNFFASELLNNSEPAFLTFRCPYKLTLKFPTS